MRLRSAKTALLVCLLIKSSSAWSNEDRQIRKGDPSPFDGVVMTTSNYTKTYQDLEACDVWKKYLKERPQCEVFSDEPGFSLEHFAYGLILGGLVGYTIR
jgi:hypothetical protein